MAAVKSFPPRLSLFSPEFPPGLRKGFIIATCMSFLLFQLLFLANSSYIFGVLFGANSRVSNFNILFVDYDGGAIGQSIRDAYDQLSSPSIVTLYEASPSDYTSNAALRDAVCRGDYWGAMYTAPNSSQELSMALGGDLAEPYDPTAAITVYNLGARFAVVQQSYIASQASIIISAAKTAYFSSGFNAQDVGNLSTVAPILGNPFSYTREDLGPIPQPNYAFHNTASTVFIILMQFFCVLAFNGISNGFNAYKMISIPSFLGFRYVYSIIFTLIGSLLSVAYLWAFKEDWQTTSATFGGSWMAIWLSMHVHWMVLDAAGGFLPITFVPFFTFTWIIVNLSSNLMPFELSPGFYKIGYALPAHNTWEALIHIWSGGCYNRLYRNLPILFAWEIVATTADFFAQVGRCKPQPPTTTGVIESADSGDSTK